MHIEKENLSPFKGLIERSFIMDLDPDACLQMGSNSILDNEEERDDIVSIAENINKEREALGNIVQHFSIVRTSNFLDEFEFWWYFCMDCLYWSISVRNLGDLMLLGNIMHYDFLFLFGRWNSSKDSAVRFILAVVSINETNPGRDCVFLAKGEIFCFGDLISN